MTFLTVLTDRFDQVDGIITDDCDVFLFGGRSVFRNIFAESKSATRVGQTRVEAWSNTGQTRVK